MNSKTWTRIIAVTLFAALATSVRLAAQNTRYRFVDLGTLGGPTNYLSNNGAGFPLLNDAGIVSSWSDTSIIDPNAPNLCFTYDCFLTHSKLNIASAAKTVRR